ncbi:MAG: ribonuclease III [Sumerlaeia bacterium]
MSSEGDPSSASTLDPQRREALQTLVSRFGVPERDAVLTLVDQALTHRSWAAEHGGAPDNERLEFLGDAIISHATADYLYETRPEKDEGHLSKMRGAIVSRKTLGEVALALGLGELMRLGAGELNTGGRSRPSVTGSALEAIVGALSRVYSYEELRGGLREVVVEPAQELVRGNLTEDFKSRLQEMVQAACQDVPRYEVVGSSGPDHEKVFVVEARLGDLHLSRGQGQRKKYAENDAARVALERIARGELTIPISPGGPPPADDTSKEVL